MVLKLKFSPTKGTLKRVLANICNINCSFAFSLLFVFGLFQLLKNLKLFDLVSLVIRIFEKKLYLQIVKDNFKKLILFVW